MFRRRNSKVALYHTVVFIICSQLRYIQHAYAYDVLLVICFVFVEQRWRA